MIVLAFGCTDEINLPDYSYDDPLDNDTLAPVITIQHPVNDTTYSGLSQIPINVAFTDDYGIKEINFQLAPSVSAPIMNFIKSINSKTYQLDTFYPVPSSDSIEYTVLVTASDSLNRVTTVNYNFTSKD